MSESALNAGAIAIELGVPILLFIGYWLNPSRRPFFRAGLVAISPFLLIFLLITLSHLPKLGQYDFAFGAMWIMCFIPYMVFLAAGLAVGLVLVRNNAS